jgi:hypothetical protein
VSAAEELAAGTRSRPDLVPAGVPVRRGRLNLARLRRLLPAGQWLDVAVGFGTVCWVGSPGHPHPDLGRLAYRGETRVDDRGRLSLDHRVRTWLAVTDPHEFDAVVVWLPEGGLVVVPVEDFARRWEALVI